MPVPPQPFEYYVVLDFEATCDAPKPPDPVEIIEYPSVLLSGETFEPVDEFRSFVRPRVHPMLSPFCCELTGIRQDDVDSAPMFPVVFAGHVDWLRSHGLRVEPSDTGASFSFIVCGDWDLKTMFPRQCRTCRPPIQDIPAAFRRWVNVKRPFAAAVGETRTRGMAGMLATLGLTLEGRHHSGIDDCRNIAKIARCLARRGTVLATTTERPACDHKKDI